MRLTSLLVVLVGLGTGCTVGLVDETKPIEALDTATADTAEETDTDTEDTEDSGPDIDENSENPWNGECGDNLDNDGDGKVDCNDPDCVAAPECNQSADGDTDGDGYRDDVDCDPYNPYVNPGANEVDNNGIDDDCDGVVDSGSGSGGNGSGSGGSGSGNNPQFGTVCSDTCTDGFGNILYGANDGTCQDGGFGDGIALILGSAACAFGTDCSDCGVRVDADGDFHEDDPLGLGLALTLTVMMQIQRSTLVPMIFQMTESTKIVMALMRLLVVVVVQVHQVRKAIAQMVLMKTKMVLQTATTLIVLLTLHVSPLTAVVVQKY